MALKTEANNAVADMVKKKKLPIHSIKFCLNCVDR